MCIRDSLKGAENPKSWAIATRPRPSAAPLTTPANSASPELNAMVFGVADECLMAREPRMHVPPHVDLRVRDTRRSPDRRKCGEGRPRPAMDN
eukprot:8178889-Alexandrium_andersonii.AAC.1